MAEPRRILVIANETCAGAAVCDEVRYRAGNGPATVRVVAPVLAASRVGHWLASGDASSRDAAADRLLASTTALRRTGLVVEGQLGDSDPLQALDDSFRVFDPDEIIISTHPPARSNWLEREVVRRARERYPVPVTHVVVDLLHESATTHADPRPGPRAPVATLTLYRGVDYDEALAVQVGGFTNAHGPSGEHLGVEFTDAMPSGPVSDESTVFVVSIPEAAAAAYERTPAGESVRRFALPADLVNRHGPRTLVNDWSE